LASLTFLVVGSSSSSALRLVDLEANDLVGQYFDTLRRPVLHTLGLSHLHITILV
jgi:hypothetical protein